jgi:CRISPR-associated protein Csy2
VSSLIILHRLRVENANAVAGLTYGFPAMTHFLGFTHALSRRLNNSHSLRLDGCAVVCHACQIHAHASGRDYRFALMRNPLTREGKTAPFNEEGRMHMTVSLLMACHGEIANGEYGQNALADYLAHLCPTMKLAGGTIVGSTPPHVEVLDWPENTQALRRIQWRLMPGFALRDRSAWLVEHLQALRLEDPQATRLDAWLDFAALKMRAELPQSCSPDSGASAAWRYMPKPLPGYLVPIMTGWQRISPLYAPGEVVNARDAQTPFAFVEAVYGVGEWCGLHRVRAIEDILWRYHTTGSGYYCGATEPALHCVEHFD